MTVQDHELWTALGTVAAVVVALIVALTQATVAIVVSIRRRFLTRRKVASLVSAWIEHTYAPNGSGEYYRRTVKLHIANESDEPVFNVEALCGVQTEHGVVQLGPLAAPRVIPTLPPRREFVYDVTMGMLGFGEYAHDSFNSLLAEIEFTDHERKRWERTFSGELKRVKRHKQPVATDEPSELMLAQAGPVDNRYNPLSTVFAFLTAAGDESLTDSAFHQLLAVEADGWRETPQEAIGDLRKMLRSSNLAPHVWYPAPRIAYVRLPETLPGEGGPMRMNVLTLVWREERAWTLFGVGAYLPWMIHFSAGALDNDPLDNRG